MECMPLDRRTVTGVLAATMLSASLLAVAPVAQAVPAADPANQVILTTKDGKVTIQLRPDLAPKAVAQVEKLTREGFYNGLKFHRVIGGFMAQTGDPTGTGSGGSKEPDLPAEFSSAKFERGTVGMARTSDPNSANSQFFICFAPAPFLDNQYTIVGQVTAGMDVVDKIKKGEPDSGTVSDPDKIVSMKMAKGK
jgi:peptidylprolyl isomerase